MAAWRPILRAVLTVSARATFPICLRLSLEGLGSFVIHSGTGEPDCNKTFAMLIRIKVSLALVLQYKIPTILDTVRPRQ